jgi:hypothetical protein
MSCMTDDAYHVISHLVIKLYYYLVARLVINDETRLAVGGQTCALLLILFDLADYKFPALAGLSTQM